MKKIALFISMFLSFSCYAQRKITLTCDSVNVSYLVSEDSIAITEEIQVNNLSNQTIYIPDIKNRDNYFFRIGSTSFSHLGVMTSILGAPALSMELKLTEILPKEKSSFFVKIKKGDKVISDYYFSFDYVKYNAKIKKRNGELFIAMEEYLNFHKYFVNHIEGW